TKSVQELSKELTVRPQPPENPPVGTRNIPSHAPVPIPVEVTEPPTTALGYLRSLIGPLLAPAAAALIVVVFTLVLLIRREDLRDRILRLIGISQLTLATEAFDDATQRLSRYLRTQCLVNTVFAGIMALGLQEIGLPGALLWGVLAGLLRFIP